MTAAGRGRRSPATTPRASAPPRPVPARSASTAGDDSSSRTDPPPSWSQVEREGNEIAAAAATLRHRLVMGRYAGFAAGFDAGLCVCALLDTIARDRGRDMRSQRLRLDALRLARHVNADVAVEAVEAAEAAEAAPIEGLPPR